MKTIHVTASREYDVVIGAGLLDECGQRIAAAVPGAEKAVVYTDTTVFPLYAKRVTESLKAAGFTVLQDYFLAGEHSKTFRNWERILRFFTENRVSRSDVVVALGGGVVGLRRIDAPPLLETARARRLVRFLVQFFHMRAHRLDLRVQVGELALVFDSRHQPNLPVK